MLLSAEYWRFLVNWDPRRDGLFGERKEAENGIGVFGWLIVVGLVLFGVDWFRRNVLEKMESGVNGLEQAEIENDPIDTVSTCSTCISASADLSESEDETPSEPQPEPESEPKLPNPPIDCISTCGNFSESDLEPLHPEPDPPRPVYPIYTPSFPVRYNVPTRSPTPTKPRTISPVLNNIKLAATTSSISLLSSTIALKHALQDSLENFEDKVVRPGLQRGINRLCAKAERLEGKLRRLQKCE